MLRVVGVAGSLVVPLALVVNMVCFPDASENICRRESLFSLMFRMTSFCGHPCHLTTTHLFYVLTSTGIIINI